MPHVGFPKARSLRIALAVALPLSWVAVTAATAESPVPYPGPYGLARTLPAPRVVHMPTAVRPVTDAVGRVITSLPQQALPWDADATTAVTGRAAKSPVSPVRLGNRSGVDGFTGIDLLQQTTAGTGSYKGTQFGLEPPDQALCAGNGYVVESVNQAVRVYTVRGVPVTPVIPLDQWLGVPPLSDTGPGDFLSDPRCLYDASTHRFVFNILEIDSNPYPVFTRSHNIVLVSKTGNPAGSWYQYSFDVTDDGQMGTPMHVSCPCLGDQPLLGIDRNGIYISDNEYSDSEVYAAPLPPPPAVEGVEVQVFNNLPDYRNGQAQVYALPKAAMLSGHMGPMVQFDTATVPLPANSPHGALWYSLQPAHAPAGDRTAAVRGGVEYFLSALDFAAKSDNRVGVWALTGTDSLGTAQPHLKLLNDVITTRLPGESYSYPRSANQKPGPLPLSSTCIPAPCTEEQLAGNDDRMNEVTLFDGNLWSGVNTLLPNDSAGKPRTGAMYFEVRPRVSGDRLSASMVRDGYVQVADGSVLFPSIAAAPHGIVVMGFSVSGVNYFPSAGWARLDGVSAHGAPVVHVSGVGKMPEDGFTGTCLGGVPPIYITNIAGMCSDGVSRWGDYSFSDTDEHGCIWTAAEYISGRDVTVDNGGDWSTYVTRIPTNGCKEGSIRR